MYEFNRWLLKKVGSFPRDQRFVLGQRMANTALDIQGGLIGAALTGEREGKAAALRLASLQVEQLRYLLRLCKDEKYISTSAWHFGAGRLLEVGRMLGGWIKTAN